MARPAQLARPSSPPGECGLLDTAAGGDHKSHEAETSPAFNIKLTQGSALAPFSSTLTQKIEVANAHGSVVRHHQAFPTEHSSPERLVPLPCTALLINSQEVCAVLNSHRTPRSTSLDYTSLESISALSAQTYFSFRWDQQRLSCALMRSGGLKPENMLCGMEEPSN